MEQGEVAISKEATSSYFTTGIQSILLKLDKLTNKVISLLFRIMES